VRLEAIDADQAVAIVAGDLGDRRAAPGWPTESTTPGLSFATAGGVAFLVYDDDGLVAGECGTKAPPDVDGMVEIGYGLAAPSRGRGLGGRAVAALVDAVAVMPGVRLIDAEIHVSNTPSRRVVERLGFTLCLGPLGGYGRYRREAAGGEA
jgi:GNAT superfamily N-acetyltransferase